MQKKKWDWELAFTVRGGHRYWRDKESGRIAVADESGDHKGLMGRPHDTEDGALWLHPTKPVEVGTEHCSIPLLVEGDKGPDSVLHTGASPVEALKVAHRLGIPLLVHERGMPSLWLDVSPTPGRVPAGSEMGPAPDRSPAVAGEDADEETARHIPEGGAILDAEQAAALVRWADEAHHPHGCSGWGERFDAAFAVAESLRGKKVRLATGDLVGCDWRHGREDG